MRKTREETINDEKKMEQIQKHCLQLGETVCFTDTIVKKRIGKRNRKKTGKQKLLEFSCAKLVITDRIHGMLFAALTGTPCIALNNVSGKVSGAYEWIRHLDYIQFVEEQKLTKETVNNLLKIQGGRYSNRELSGFYSLMKKEITS